MKHRVCFWIVLLMLASFASFSNTIDSLQSAVNKAGRDTALFDKLTKAIFSQIAVNPAASGKYCREGYAKATSIHYLKGQADMLNVIGVSFLYQGQFDSALVYFNSALELKKKLNIPRSSALTINNIGICYHYTGDYQRALMNYLKALKINEEVNDTSGISMGYNNVAMIYEQQKKLDDALMYYQKALHFGERLGDENRIAYSHINCGVIYMAQHKKQAAIDEFLKSIPVLEKNKEKKYLSQAYNNLGGIYLESNEYEKSLDYFLKSQIIRELINDQQGLAETLQNIGNVYLSTSELNKCIAVSTKAYELAKKVNYLATIRDASLCLAKANAKKGDFKAAYNWNNEYLMYKDSLFNSDNSRLMSEMESKYETEKKELEIENLKNKQALNEAELKTNAEELKRQNIIKLFFATGFILMVVLAFFIFKSYRQKQKANEIITAQKSEVEHQKSMVEEKNKEITDSITYAKHLQMAILPSENFVNAVLSNNFILYKPKDIVAGDFYWVEEFNNYLYVAVADCTGHGVPGAMVSVVCSNALNRALKEFKLQETGELLDKTAELVVETFQKSGHEINDGMDICLLRIEKNSTSGTTELQWSGANNPLWIITAANQQLLELKPDKQPVGKFDHRTAFNSVQTTVKQNDMIYLFSDGYADQFGGEKGKKFKNKPLQDLLIRIHANSMIQQKESLEKTFIQWQGKLEQVDDICILGIRI